MIVRRSSIVLMIAALAIPATSAASPLFFNYLGESTTTNLNFTIAMEFTVGGQDLRVLGLAYYDLGGDGLALPAQVGIWDVVTQALVGSGTVPAGTAGTLVQDWRFAPVSPFILLANTTYRIGALQTGLDPDPFGGTFSVFGGVSSVTGGNFSHVPGFAFPAFAQAINARLLANADVELASTAVPEPTALALCATGLAAIAGRRRSRVTRTCPEAAPPAMSLPASGSRRRSVP